MAVTKLTFKREEYDQYDTFTEYNPSRDMTTTVFLPFYAKAGLKRFYRNTSRLILTDTKGREIDSFSRNLFYPLTRAVAFECALLWIRRVGNLPFDNKIFNSPGVASLPDIIVPTFSGPLGSKRFLRTNAIMPRFVRGMFTEPVRDFDVFPVGFSYPYALIKFLLLKNELPQALTEDAKYELKRCDKIIDLTLEKIRSVIATGGSYVSVRQQIRHSSEVSKFLQYFIDQGYLALSQIRKEFAIIDELSKFSFDPYLDGYWTIVVIDPKDLEKLRTVMKEFEFKELPGEITYDNVSAYGNILQGVELWKKMHPDGKLFGFFKVHKSSNVTSSEAIE